MRLLELCLSPGFGGLELYAVKSNQFYQRTGTFCIAVVRKNSKLEQRMREAKCPLTTLKVVSRYFPFLAAWRLARLCKQYNITTVHIHWRGDLPLAVFAKMLSHTSIRLVYTRQMAMSSPKFGIYHRLLYAGVDAYITISKKLESDARKFLPLAPEKIHQLYYGVPAPDSASDSLCEAYFADNKLKINMFTIGMFGRIEESKGQYLLIDAIRLLENKGIFVQAAIIGHAMTDGYLDSLKSCASEVQDGNVRFTGFHPNPPSIMGCFDVVVLASKAETFGLVLAEAMRAGTAVIGSNAGGVPEIIEHGKTGMLFESQDVNGLADCIESLYADPALRQKIAKAGKDYADQQFCEARHFERLTQHLENI